MERRQEQAIPQQDRQAIEEMKRRGLTVTKPLDAQQVKAWEDAVTVSRHHAPADGPPRCSTWRARAATSCAPAST
jgi:hypothetical protein